MTDIRSPKLAELARQIEADEPDALDAFWHQVQREGTPLIEPHPELDHARLTTFLYQSDQPLENVAVMHWLRGKEFGDDTLMRRLDGTDLWYLTIDTHRELICTYRIAVNDSLEPVTPDNAQVRMKDWTSDPLNRHPMHRWRASEEEPEIIDSVIVMSDSPAQIWLGRKDGVAAGQVTEHTFSSKILDNERSVFVYTPAGYSENDRDLPLLIHWDAQWRDLPMQIPETMDNLIAAEEIPPMLVVFISNLDRNLELPCNEDVARAVATELVPWMGETFGATSDPSRIAAAGQSYGGLASTWLAFKHPDVVGNVLSQSGSYWWSPDFKRGEPLTVIGDTYRGAWLNHQFAEHESVPVRFWMEAGTLENGPIGDGFTPSLILSNRYLVDIMHSKGYDVTYREFIGGHDFAIWRGSIADGLIYLFGKQNQLDQG